jgi:hypothetical protein
MAANPNTFPQLLDALTEVLYDDEKSSRYDSHTILSALALTTLETITTIAQTGGPDTAVHRTMQRLAEQFGQALRSDPQ